MAADRLRKEWTAMANIFMRFPEGKPKALTLSYDDGVEQDRTLMDILDKRQIKCTFNINTGCFTEEGTVYPKGHIHRRLTKKAAVELFRNSGHEVAVHALTHPWLEKLPQNAVVHEILSDRKNIEALFGTMTRGMAYPYGTYSDNVVQVLQDCGIVYARTTQYTEKFDIPGDWLRLKATCHHNNPKLPELTERFVKETPDRAPWLFYLWGHSYEFERDDNWNVIENFAEKAGGHDDTWYAVNIDIYDYVKAYERLVFAPDLSMVYNPSAITVWFLKEGQLYSVKPGETKTVSLERT